ncbi:Uncharacterized protein Fot_31309 [Forsythia ovata]|uniref:Uncharacterized protein n=1 Tax=Forsythia ovata TaxID=205694 RepID=A0ABD1T4R0_9LAMI
MHVGVDYYRTLRGFGMGKGFEEGVVNESVGFSDMICVEGECGGVEEVEGVAGGNEVVGDGGVGLKIVEDQLGLNLVEVGRGYATGGQEVEDSGDCAIDFLWDH